MGIQVAANGSNVQTMTGPKTLMQNTQPFTKLDVTKDSSFKTISILFNTEPPQPTVPSYTSTTLLYQYDHGYNDYIPAIWMEWQNQSPAYPAPPGAGGHATTFFDFGDDTANQNLPGFGSTTGLSLYARIQWNADPTYGTATTTAFLYAEADKTKVSIYMEKISFSFGTPAPIFVIGTTVNLRVYTFAEPAITSTY